jgi:branched-chain amino acid transport system ATP-binding protein
VSGQTAIAGKGNDLLKNPDVGRLFLGGWLTRKLSLQV